MKALIRIVLPFAALALALVVREGRAQPAAAPIAVEAPWLRATPKSAPVAGGYATIVNTGTVADRLVGATLPIAAEGQVHTMSMANGVMHMERLADGLALPPGARVALTPGGDHLMFLKPTRPLKEGERIEGALLFEKAGRVPVTFVVGSMAAKHAPGAKASEAAGHSMHDMPGMDMNMPGMGKK